MVASSQVAVAGPVAPGAPDVEVACAEAGAGELSRRVLLIAALVTAGLVATTLLGELSAGTATWVLAVDAGIGLLGCVTLPLLRHRPVAASALLVVLAALSPAGTPPVGAATLGVTLARGMRVGAATAVAAGLAQLLRALWRPQADLPLGWWALIVLTSQAALLGWGAMARARRALIVSLQERARRAEREQARQVAEARLLERTRIAGEMHDVLAHRLSLLSTYAGALEYHPDAPPAQLTKAVSVIRDSAHQALEELREVIGVLRHQPDGIGAPQPQLCDVATLVGECRDAGMRVELRDEVRGGEELPAGIRRTVYRIVQEGLTNARKHATGQPVLVRLCGTPGDGLAVEISNPLSVGPHAPTAPGSGTGLIGLGERVALAEGTLEHGATVDSTWRLAARLPWAV